jgi:hypothetical protein
LDLIIGVRKYKARVSSATTGGLIEIRLDGKDGKKIGYRKAEGTGDWEKWIDCSAVIEVLNCITGKHDVYLIFKSNSPQNYALFNVDWIKFNGGCPEKI